MISAAKNLQTRLEQLFEPLLSSQAEPSLRARLGVYMVVAIAFLVEIVFTRSSFFADTYFYIEDISGYMRGSPAAAIRMWDFGHILLRPLGVALSPIAAHFAHSNTANVQLWSITVALVAMSWVSTLICAIYIAALGLQITRSPLASTVAAIGFLYTNTIINLSRAGTSYIPGIACITIATYVASGRRSRGWLPGLFAGTAVLLWVPYILTIPAVLLSRVLSPASGRPSGSRRFVDFAVRFCIFAGLVIGLGYSIAIFSRGISNWADLMHWIREASHDESRQGRIVRLFFGLPRSLIAMNNDGILFKRFLFHDPYARVTWLDVLRVSLAKVVIFYLAAAFLIRHLLMSVTGRRVFVIFVLALIPNLLLAIAFESGSMERYLATFPFLFLSAAVVSEWPPSSFTGVGIALLICALSIGNAVSLSTNSIELSERQENTRIAALSRCNNFDIVFLLTAQDGLFAMRYRPFDTSAKKLPYLVPIQPLGGDIAAWRSKFAASTLETWNRGREVWVTSRVLAKTPEPGWNWVEGDDSRISWIAVHRFFDQLEPGGVSGGSDEIFKIAPSERNRQILSGLMPYPRGVRLQLPLFSSVDFSATVFVANGSSNRSLYQVDNQPSWPPGESAAGLYDCRHGEDVGECGSSYNVGYLSA